MAFGGDYQPPNFFQGLSSIGDTLQATRIQNARNELIQSGIPLSQLPERLMAIGDTQGAQIAATRAHTLATEDLAQKTLAFHQLVQSPEYQARLKTAELTAAQPFEKLLPVQPGTSLANPRTGEIVSQNNEANLSPEAIDQRAEQAIAGDQAGAFQGLAYRDTINRAAISKRIAEKRTEQGITGSDQALRNAQYGGTKTEARVVATRSGQLAIPMNAFESMAPLALEASQSIDRTRYPTLNSIKLAVLKGTGDENVVALHNYLTTLANTYARAVTPLGQSTDKSRDKAYSLFEEGYSKGQLATSIDSAHREMAAEKQGVGQAKKEIAVPGAPSTARTYPQPTPEAIQLFRNNSAKRGEAQKFEEAFGPGSAAQALRGQ